MVQIVIFLLTFVFSYIIYYMISLRPELNRIEFEEAKVRKVKKKLSEKQKMRMAKKQVKFDKKKLPSEIAFVIYRYQLDPESPYYRRFLLSMGVSTAFDLAVAVTVGSLVDSLFVQVVIGLAILLVLALISYHLIGKHFIRKGMKKKCIDSKK